MPYHTTTLLPNSCGPMTDGLFWDHFGTPRVGPIHIPNIGPIDEGWYQYRPWNFTHRDKLIESSHMAYHTTALLPNTAAQWQMAISGPKDLSYSHPKYWTNRWRFDINIGHVISTIRYSQENQGTWHIIRRHYYQIPAAHRRMANSGPQGSLLSTPQILDPSMEDWYQYRPWNLNHRAQLRESRHMTSHTTALLPNSCGAMAMVHFGTPRIYPIHTPIIGPIEEGLISISAMESRP